MGPFLFELADRRRRKRHLGIRDRDCGDDGFKVVVRDRCRRLCVSRYLGS